MHSDIDQNGTFHCKIPDLKNVDQQSIAGHQELQAIKPRFVVSPFPYAIRLFEAIWGPSFRHFRDRVRGRIHQRHKQLTEGKMRPGGNHNVLAAWIKDKEAFQNVCEEGRNLVTRWLVTRSGLKLKCS